MSTTTTTTKQVQETQALPPSIKIAPRSANAALKVDGTDPTFGDWRDDLVRDGFAVIKGAIPRERADQYADQMYSWLEGLYALPKTQARLA